MEFSRPYFDVYRVVVTRGDSQVKGVDDLASAVASVTAGSSHEQHLLGLGVPRASIMTGLQVSHHGAWNVGTSLPEDVPTLAQRLADAGYTCW